MTNSRLDPASCPRKILIVVPYRARDLEGLALVGHHLRNRYGHEVVFSNGYGIEQKLLKHSPDAVLLDHLVWDFKAREARAAKELGMKVLVLPTEGFHQNKEEAVRIAGKLTGVSHIVDCHFAWGDYVRDAVLEQGLASEERVHTIGCPRFDFYSEPYLSLVTPRSQFLTRLGIPNPEAPMILWATNTTYVARNQEKMFKRQVARGRLPEDEIRKDLEDENTQFRENSAVVLEMARQHREWNVVVKVHPAEWINPYAAMCKAEPNMHLAFNAPINEFIYHCDVLLQRGCTTGTEAWMLRKPVLELEVGAYHRSAAPEYLAGNHIVRTSEEAIRVVEQYLRGMGIPLEQRRARDEFIDYVYHRIDGQSSERCAQIVHSIVSPPSYTDEDRQKTQSAVRKAHGQWLRNQNGRIPNRLKDTLGIRRDASLRLWKKFTRDEATDNLGQFVAEPEITAEMVSGIYERYDRLLGTCANNGQS